MEIILNGTKREAAECICLADLLTAEGFQKNRIAVELNENIIPKKSYEEVILHEGDILEVVSFVGGG